MKRKRLKFKITEGRMLNKINKNLIRAFVFALLIINMVLPNDVFAKSSVTIDLRGKSESLDFSNRRLSLWKVSSDLLEDEKVNIAENLKNLSDEQITKRYSAPISTEYSNRDGIINIELESGTYYAREITDSAVKVYPFVFTVSEKNFKVIPKGGFDIPPGNTKLIKVSTDGTRLQGAEFELYFVKNDGVERVPLNGNVYSPSGSRNEILTTDVNGEIVLYDLPIGDYMFKELKAPNGYMVRQAETYFTINSSRSTEVRIVNYRAGEGGFKFKKISEDGTPLTGAKFMVTKKVGDIFEKVRINNVEYVVESTAEGYFTVDGLPFGEYFLWETQPPKGHSALSDSVRFVIEEGSFNQMIEISDRRIPEVPPANPPVEPPIAPEKPPIVIPKTGDITLLLMVLVGGVFSAIGYRLVREDNDTVSVKVEN